MSAPLPLETTWEALRDALSQAAQTPRLIDCREADEWDICRIEGATLVPLSHFAERAPQVLGSDTARHIVVYCHHGVRSMRATQWLRQQGYENTQSLRGGIDLWADCVDESMRKY
jgi:rhodanese-related sulfurtransferase